MLAVISDMHHVLAVLQLKPGADLKALRSEYESILYPGPNPHRNYMDSPEQRAWVERVREREQFLTMKYGGVVCGDGTTAYSPVTFANWLVREKGAGTLSFREYCMVEFD